MLDKIKETPTDYEIISNSNTIENIIEKNPIRNRFRTKINPLKNMMNYTILALAAIPLMLNITNAQNITISGHVENQEQISIQVPIGITQLVGNDWEERTATMSDENGDYNASLIFTNIKSQENTTPTKYYVLNGNTLNAPKGTTIKITNRTILGETIGNSIYHKINEGLNRLQTPTLNHLANSIYLRQIEFENGETTVQKFSKVNENIYYGNQTKTIPLKTTNNRNTLGKNEQTTITNLTTHPDSIYFRIIANQPGLEGHITELTPDTITIARNKYNPENITGLQHTLTQDSIKYNIQIPWKSSLGKSRTNETINLEINGKNIEYTSNNEGILNIKLTIHKDSSKNATIHFQELENRLNAKVIHKKGSMLDQKPVAITDHYAIYPTSEVYNTMQINLDSLQNTSNKTDIMLFDFDSQYQTNTYAGGILDLKNPEHRSIFESSGQNSTWTSTYTDSLWFITSDINQEYGTPIDPIIGKERDSTLTDVAKILNLEGTGLEDWKRVNFAGTHKYDNVEDNELIHKIYAEKKGYNYAIIAFSNFNGNSRTFDDSLRIKNAKIYFTPRPTDGNITSEIFAGILHARDPTTISLKVGDYFHAIDIEGYRNTKFTEAAWGCTQLKLFLPQNYPLGR